MLSEFTIRLTLIYDGKNRQNQEKQEKRRHIVRRSGSRQRNANYKWKYFTCLHSTVQQSGTAYIKQFLKAFLGHFQISAQNFSV